MERVIEDIDITDADREAAADLAAGGDEDDALAAAEEALIEADEEMLEVDEEMALDEMEEMDDEPAAGDAEPVMGMLDGEEVEFMLPGGQEPAEEDMGEAAAEEPAEPEVADSTLPAVPGECGSALPPNTGCPSRPSADLPLSSFPALTRH